MTEYPRPQSGTSAAEESGPLRSKRAALHSLGCRLNHAETALIRRQLEAEGYEIVPWGEPADLCVVNSCTVTGQADAKSRQALRSARRHSPAGRVAVTGCFAELNAQSLADGGLADVVVGNGEKLNLTHHIAAQEARDEAGYVAAPRMGRRAFRIEAPAFRSADLLTTDGGTRAHVKVQDGCDFMCSFCIIPKARGRSRPRALDDLLAEGRVLAEAGVREVVLSGVNLGTYGEGPHTLTDVVDALAALPGIARIRISSIEPTTVEDGLLDRMAAPDHALVPFLHLPLQSGDASVLAAMRRRYTPETYRRFAEGALARVPGLCLGTDVMVGFPGESDEAFAATVALLEALPFAYAHIFPYSERAGTPAARRADPVPAAVRQWRAAVLRALSERKRQAFHRRFLGETLEVLFERPKTPGRVQGYTANYVRVEVAVEEAEALRNQLRPVRLLEAGVSAVAGTLAG